ncbi:MFS transporter [Sphingosinicella rhizophila]|uniref:MFS transporter n=1 Tax=Sphingosinicella rhizophila TaxID=3050082 RepID=A0ABU3Q3Y7_9SPHN|nr:MFS transporter [Sphingosinicella sp. GR2756]MDT9598126.1 MFS transporter [Sphingosinicella sp. GR2756]
MNDAIRQESPTVAAGAVIPTRMEEAALAKAFWRLIPLLGLLYFISFLDRVNVGFAALTMNQDIGLSAAAYGFGAGIFFLGYFLFEIPSNLMLERVGARRWIARIMVTWGILSVAMAFVTGPVSFWIVRFLLGAAEAGFFPGIILYLTYWFPGAMRGRIMGWFLMALPLSNAIGAPFSTWLLGHSVFGLAGWQTMFVVEGLPAILLGLLVLRILPDKPAKASWLDSGEAVAIEAVLVRDSQAARHVGLRAGLTSPRVWHFAFIYFGIVIGLYGFGFWAPQMIKAFGDLSNQQVGLLTTAPYLLVPLGMYLWGRRSDRQGERRWHLALAAFLGATGFAASALTDDPMLKMAAFMVAAMGVYAALPIFWTLPTAFLSGTAAAGGIALINSIGNLGGYFGPAAIGHLKDQFGFGLGLLVLAAGLASAGGLALLVPRDRCAGATSR